MRTIINISVPASVKEEVEYEVKSGGYASVSEFFRALIRERKENILARDIEQSRYDFKAEKGRVLHSLKELR